MARPLAALALLLAAAAAPAQEAPAPAAPRERFLAELRKVYDYLPFDVPPEVRKAKVAEMDGFWAFVASDLKTYRPLLREALRDEKQNRYFLYDGAGLLLEHAEGKEDRQLAADAAARCRSKDVGRGYFHFCHRLAGADIDPTPAILQLLDDPKFRVYITGHSLWLEQVDCVRFCLLRYPEERWVPHLVRRLPGEKDTVGARTLLRCLAEAMDPAADAAVRAVAEDDGADVGVRTYAVLMAATSKAPDPPAGTPARTREEFDGFLAKSLQAGRLLYGKEWTALRREAGHHVLPSDGPRLRELRRMTAGRLSDEALLDITYIDGLLRRAVTAGK